MQRYTSSTSAVVAQKVPPATRKALSKKSLWPKFPDFNTSLTSLFSSGVMTGTPGATLGPILNAW